MKIGIPIAWYKARIPAFPRKSIREGASSLDEGQQKNFDFKNAFFCLLEKFNLDLPPKKGLVGSSTEISISIENFDPGVGYRCVMPIVTSFTHSPFALSHIILVYRCDVYSPGRLFPRKQSAQCQASQAASHLPFGSSCHNQVAALLIEGRVVVSRDVKLAPTNFAYLQLLPNRIPRNPFSPLTTDSAIHLPDGISGNPSAGVIPHKTPLQWPSGHWGATDYEPNA